MSMMAPLSPDTLLPEYGSLVGPWLVRERIGEGSHGLVFRAAPADRPEDNRYALKLALKPGDERFEREAHLLSRVKHPSVPRFEAKGSWMSPRGEEHPYLVMQWVEGMNLYSWALEKGLTLRKAIGCLVQVARALEAMHRYGGVHRDVKGGNVRVSGDGHAVLLDFGSCWYQGASPLTDGVVPPGTGLYRSQQLLFFEFVLNMGAAQYYEAQPADDVYALGITAYRLLAGVYPPRDSEGAVLLVAPPGLDKECPELSALILRMLSEDPQARGSAGEVADELERLLKHRRPALDRRWAGSPSHQPTEKTRRLAPLWEGVKQLASFVAPAGGLIVLGVLGVVLVRHVDRRGAAFTELGNEPRAKEKPDAGTSLGEESVASVAPAKTPPVSESGLSRDVLPEPKRGQKRPPCTERGEVAINGGCWGTLVGAESPPCGANQFEYQERCYVPILVSDRVPTSEDPQ
jgi:serine/threonine protein kinase